MIGKGEISVSFLDNFVDILPLGNVTNDLILDLYLNKIEEYKKEATRKDHFGVERSAAAICLIIRGIPAYRLRLPSIFHGLCSAHSSSWRLFDIPYPEGVGLIFPYHPNWNDDPIMAFQLPLFIISIKTKLSWICRIFSYGLHIAIAITFSLVVSGGRPYDHVRHEGMVLVAICDRSRVPDSAHLLYYYYNIDNFPLDIAAAVRLLFIMSIKNHY